jgi:hypothetical protein
MKAKVNKALATYRKKIKRNGQRRVELRVNGEDVSLLRAVADALMNPESKVAARALLRRHFGKVTSKDIKDYLASAPLEGIDLSRQREFPRDVEL